MLRILTDKKYVEFRKEGKAHVYVPLVLARHCAQHCPEAAAEALLRRLTRKRSPSTCCARKRSICTSWIA